MKTESIEVDGRFGEEYRGKYVFGEITWAKRSRIIQKHTQYNRFSGEVEGSDFIAIQAETILASLHGQPENHPITLEKLLSEEAGVPIGLGELFSQITNKLNNLSVDDARFLSDASDAKDPTQQSPSSVSAKNLAGPQTSSRSSQPESSSSSQSSSES